MKKNINKNTKLAFAMVAIISVCASGMLYNFRTLNCVAQISLGSPPSDLNCRGFLFFFFIRLSTRGYSGSFLREHAIRASTTYKNYFALQFFLCKGIVGASAACKNYLDYLVFVLWNQIKKS